MSIRRRTFIIATIVFSAALAGAAWYRLRTPLVSRGDIVATVDGTAITARDLEARLAVLLPAVSFHANLSPDKVIALRRAALDQLILEAVIVRDALDRGTQVDERAVDAEMKAVRERFKTQAEYARALQDSGYTEDEFRAMLRREAIVQQAMAGRAPARPEPDAIRAYYDANPSKFERPDRIRLQEILLAVETGASASAWKTRERDAAKVVKRIEGGEDIGALARELSTDEYAANEGKLGWVHRGRLTPAFETAAFAAPLGTPQVVRSEFGYHVFVVREREDARQLTVEEATPAIVERLTSAKAADADRAWRDELLSHARIDIRDPQLRDTKPFEMNRPGSAMPPAATSGMPAGHPPIK